LNGVVHCEKWRAKMLDKNTFIEESKSTLVDIVDSLNKVESINLEDLENGKTVLVIVDMINGFAKKGALMSPRVDALIPEIERLSKACDIKGIEKIAFADYHNEDSAEFESYIPHCMSNTEECEVVDEIKTIGGYLLINKNSTNGFLEEEFQQWFKGNKEIVNYIVVGDCTDICIQQFTLTVKAWFNKENIKSRIIVPINAVDTYDFEMHNGDLTNIMALYSMSINGVEIVKNVK